MRNNPSIIPQNYNNLLEECREIIVESEFTSRWALVEGYHAIGEKISKEETSRVTQLAKDLHKEPRLLQRCKQFYKKYPKLEMLPEGKNTSWHQIVNKYLPETTTEKTITFIECPFCHKTWEK